MSSVLLCFRDSVYVFLGLMSLRMRVVRGGFGEIQVAAVTVMVVNVRGGGQVDGAERQEDERLQRPDDQT